MADEGISADAKRRGPNGNVRPPDAPRGLVCGKCGHGRLRVLYTRGKSQIIIRRRECRNCGARLTTWERAAGRVLDA